MVFNKVAGIGGGGIFVLQGTFGNAWRQCWLSQRGGGVCHWHLGDKSQECAQGPIMHRTVPRHNRRYPAQNVNKAEFRNPAVMAGFLIIFLSPDRAPIHSHSVTSSQRSPLASTVSAPSTNVQDVLICLLFVYKLLLHTSSMGWGTLDLSFLCPEYCFFLLGPDSVSQLSLRRQVWPEEHAASH